MRISNELRCWFSKVSKVLPKWICIPNILNELKKYFFIHHVNGAFLMNVARNRVKQSLKIEFYNYRKTRDLCYLVCLVLQLYQIWRL